MNCIQDPALLSPSYTQLTDKHYHLVVIISGNPQSVTHVGVHYYVMQKAWVWLLMEVILMSNGHHKERSKLKQ